MTLLAYVPGTNHIPLEIMIWLILGTLTAAVAWVSFSLWLDKLRPKRASMQSNLEYIRSGQALGQTRAQLGKRFRPENRGATEPQVAYFDLGSSDREHYYAKVEFDPLTGKAIRTEAVYDGF